MITTVDADFLALPLEKVSDAALNAATGAGASHADVRIERTRTGLLSLRDAKPETQSDETNFGIGVRVIVNGAWGFASSPDVSVESAQKLAATAVAASFCADSTLTSGDEAKPHAPLTITRTPIPKFVSSDWVSGFASRRESKPVRVRSIRTSA